MTYQILQGDCLERLKDLPDGSVNCAVTSPPYYGLRNYGTANWEGGDEGCDHSAAKIKSRYDYSLDSSPIQKAERTGTDGGKYRNECPSCGAVNVDRQIGLEETPEQYIAKMVMVMREVRRVLRDDGTLWLNIGDSYLAQQGSGFPGTGQTNIPDIDRNAAKSVKRPSWMKPKDLMGIPWMLAFALRDDGWWLRQDIIWAKPNPMPESITDRCTKSHEYIFLLSKSARYYYDQNAIKEPGVTQDASALQMRNKRSVWTVNTYSYPGAHFATYPPDLIEPCILAGCPEGGTVLDPFTGSGTTGEVALLNNRNFIGVELNPEYIELAHQRIGAAEIVAKNKRGEFTRTQQEIAAGQLALFGG